MAFANLDDTRSKAKRNNNVRVFANTLNHAPMSVLHKNDINLFSTQGKRVLFVLQSDHHATEQFKISFHELEDIVLLL